MKDLKDLCVALIQEEDRAMQVPERYWDYDAMGALYGTGRPAVPEETCPDDDDVRAAMLYQAAADANPYKNLLMATLLRAYEDLSLGHADQGSRRDAARWFRSTEQGASDEGFTFEYVCDQLDFPADKIRDALWDRIK